MMFYDKEGREVCISESKCPKCGNNIWFYNKDEDDLTLGTYCTNDNCDFRENQYLSYQDMSN